MSLAQKIRDYLDNADIGDLMVRSITQPDGTVTNMESLTTLQENLETAESNESLPEDYGSIKIAGDM